MFPAAVARVAHPAPAPHSRNPVMYSMILMSALATGPQAPQFGGYLFHGCGGCGGTTTAASCTGCCGGCGGLFSGDRIRNFFNMGGGCGGCCGGRAAGFATSCTGCCGGAAC